MSEKDFLQKVNAHLDEQAEHLDAATQSRLNQARQRALEHVKSSEQDHMTDVIAGTRFRWLPASAMAGIAIVALGSFLFLQNINTVPEGGLDDPLEIVTSNNNLDMYEQLDFYMWLVEEDNSAS